MYQLLSALGSETRLAAVVPQSWLRQLTTALLLAAVVGGTTSCARHASLQQKTRWYKHHAGKTTPCPCGH
jgi:hypothetical protein